MNGLEIPKTRQCELMSMKNINILHAIDEIATDNSECGYRFIHQQLLEDGYSVGRHRVLKYMGIS